MNVKIITTSKNRHYKVGTVRELPQEMADHWIQKGLAELDSPGSDSDVVTKPINPKKKKNEK